MSQPIQFYQWQQEVVEHFPHLSKPQAQVLSAFSFGLAGGKRCTLSRVAEELGFLGKPDTVERRLQRFLGNEQVCWQEGARALTAWVLSMLPGQAGKSLVLLVDETSLKDRLKVMAVSLAYRGRALPLAWWCYRQEEWPLGQVDLITSLLRQVADAVAPGTHVVVQADRGIGNSPAMLRAIEGLGWYYLVRVNRHVRLHREDGSEVSFAQMAPKPGTRWRGAVGAFKKAGWLRCFAHVHWKKGQREPWLLVTNLPEAQSRWYAQRMWEELAFRDFKSTGWEWERSRVWQPDRANRLWLVMAVAYAWVLTLGTQVIRTPALRKALTKGRAWRRNVFQLGLRCLRFCLAQRRRLPFPGALVPHGPPLQKTVVQ